MEEAPHTHFAFLFMYDQVVTLKRLKQLAEMFLVDFRSTLQTSTLSTKGKEASRSLRA
jgi:hypothetical protein